MGTIASIPRYGRLTVTEYVDRHPWVTMGEAHAADPANAGNITQVELDFFSAVAVERLRRERGT